MVNINNWNNMHILKLIIVIILLSATFCNPAYSQEFLDNLPKDKKISELTLYDYRQAFDSYWQEYNVVNGYYIDKTGKKQKAAYWKQFNRWYYDMEKRVNIETGAFPNTSAAEQYSIWLKNNPQNNSNNQGFTSGPLYASLWTSVGPNSSGGGYSGTGRLNCVAFHPGDNNIFWVGSPSGGLWVTTNGGANWTPLTDNNAVLGVSDIGIPSDYASTSTIYIATGDRDGGSMWSLGGGQSNDNNSIGVLKSTDGGSTWSTTGLTYTVSQRKILSKILVHPSSTSTLYVAGTDGILKSTDGGTNWTNIYNSKAVFDIEFKPGDPTVLYASTNDYSGTPLILKSTNSGSTWSSSTISLSTNERRIELAVSSANSSYVYAVVTTRSGGLKGIYKSTDSGSTFSQTYDGTATNHNLLSNYTDGSGGTSGQGNYDLSLAVSNSNIDEVYVAGIITHKSTDGGSSWNAVNCWTSSSTYNKNSSPVVHADHHMLKIRSSDGSLFEVNDGGIYKTTNSGSSWTHLTGDLVISQLYRLSVAQTTTNEVLAGLQDNGTKLYSSSSWTDVKGGDGMDCQIDPNNVNTQYGAYVYGQITRTTNHWSSTTDIEPSAAGNGWWMTPYVIDPNNNNTLYAGYADLYKTTDQGNNWSKISSVNTTNIYGTGDIRAIAIAPSNSNYIYMSDPNTIWSTTNGGSSWTDITGSLPVSTNSITYIAVKSNDPNTVWVTFGGYDSDRIYESTNGGTSWTNISTGLPSLPVMCVIENTLNSSNTELYVGTDVGIYLKTGSNNWTGYNTGLPNVVVNDLDIYYDSSTPSNSRLYAGTSGRGVWMSPLNSTGCTAPTTQATNFSSSNLATTSMDISWTRGNGNKVIVLAHENAVVDSDPVSGTSYTANASFGTGDQIGTGNYVVYDGTGTSVSITNLTSGATMNYALYEYNTVDNCYLIPALTGSATTLGPPTVTTTAATSISSSGATSGGNVTSINGSSLTHKGVCWSISANPTIADNKTDDITSGTGTGSYTSSITGLSASTQYHVRAYATNSSGTSYGSDETFTTACGVITTYPYTQDFDSWTTSSPAYSCTADGSVSLSNCWSNVAGDDIDWDIYSGATGSSDTGPTTGNGGSGNYLYTESSSCYNSTGYIITTNFDLTAVTNPQLSFYYHMYGADMGTLSVQISTDGGSTWSSDIWILSGDQGNSWQQAIISIGAYSTSTNAVIRFKAITGTNYTSDIAIDDFKIETGPTCPNPSSQTETSITLTSAKLEWTENGGTSTWEIEYGPTGFSQGSGTTISTSSNPYSLTGLSGSTGYDWYVRSNCGGGDYSSWVGPSSFVTSCGGIISVFPYSESFESSTCWQQTDVADTEGEWGINTGTVHPSGTAAQDGSKLAYFNSYTSSSGSQTRLFSPDFDISSLNSPMLSFWLYHETGYSSKDDRIQPQIYSSSSWSNVGSSVSRYDGTTGWSRYTVDISAYTDTIKVGFLATSEYGNDIHIDNTKVFDAEKKTNGNITKCSPYFVRDGGTGNLYFYDEYTFSVEISGDYDITADWTTGTSFDGYLYLYSPSFDPNSPATNLINSNDDFGTSDYSKIASEALTASTNYIVVATTKSANDIGSGFSISVKGNSIITANSTTDYNGIPGGVAHIVPSTDGIIRTSDYECDDNNDWTHYYDDNGTTSDYSDDNILLSVKKNSNTFGITSVTLAGSSGASEILESAAPYVSSFGGWFVFNRYWELSPTTQPITDVNVRYYYTSTDFSDLNTALSNDGRSTISNQTDLSFLKINDLTSSGYDPNPVNGQLGIPKAETYNADGAWMYGNGATAATNRWALGSYNSSYYAEFVVAHFSGGGGGAAGNSNDGSLPVELINFVGYAYGDVNILEWKTASELNADYFIIERKNTDDETIESIGNIKAYGNSNTINKYSLTDSRPIDEAYYRLINIDYDGAKKVGNWILVKRNTDKLKLLNIYPNPTTNNLNLEISNPYNSNIIIEIRDVVGRVIKTFDYKAVQGLNKMELKLYELQAGTYYLSIDNNTERIVHIIFKE